MTAIAHDIELEGPPPTPEPDTEEHFRNDIGYADAFVARQGGKVRFVTNENVWLTFFSDRGWLRDGSGSSIRAIAADYARELYAEALDRAKNSDAQAGIALVKSAAGLGNRSRIEPMLAFAQCNPAVAINSEELDRSSFLVGTENGVVNLETGDFLPHSKENFVTRRLTVVFERDAAAPIFDKFLAEVQPDNRMREFLKRWAGYVLTGVIREHVLPFHYGTGSNGKSIFLEHVLLRLAGSYGAKLTDSLIYSNDRATPPFLEIAGLCGKRVAIGEENAAGAGLNEAYLKTATGGDRQKGRFHYANFVEYDPTAKLALVGNHRPRIEGRDDGIWRRFLLVDWPVKIPNEQQDTQLPEKLKAEMPGILNWCIAGAQEWMAEGLNPPESCRAATEKFRANSDSLAGFTEGFEEAKESWVTKSRVFELYREWADLEGLPRARQLTKRSLCFRLVERGWEEGRVTTASHRAFLGIKEAE